jgi:glycosyltransferase involved in cell wall biosynthesis
MLGSRGFRSRRSGVRQALAVRVLFFNPLGGLGGAERSLLDLLVSLRHSDIHVEPSLLLMGDGELATRVRELGIEVQILPMPPALSRAGESRKDAGRGVRPALGLPRAALATAPYLAEVRRTILRARPDVLHTNGMKAHLLARLAVPEVPTVVHVRDFVSTRPLTRYLLPLNRYRAIFVANSRSVAEDLQRLAPRAVTRVIYNAIDLDTFAPGPRDSGYLASLSGLPPAPPDSVLIGMVATYAWWKGHRTFLDAAARLQRLTQRSLRFYIVGGPIYGAQGAQITRPELDGLIRAAGLETTVGLVPFQSDIVRAYRGLDIVVHPSERPEPFGRVIVEAMAVEKAVVVARAGGAQELFEEAQTGFGFTPGDPDDCARALRLLVDDERLRMRLGRDARRVAEARFNRERLAAETFAVYRELLG